MPSEIDSAVFPHLAADLERVLEVLEPIRFPGRPELTALTGGRPGTSRRLVRPTLTLLSYYLLTNPVHFVRHPRRTKYRVAAQPFSRGSGGTQWRGRAPPRSEPTASRPTPCDTHPARLPNRPTSTVSPLPAPPPR